MGLAVATGLSALAVVGSLILLLWLTAKLATALDAPWMLWVVACFIPYVGPLIPLALNSRATAVLKDAGLKVGLLGAKVPTA